MTRVYAAQCLQEDIVHATVETWSVPIESTSIIQSTMSISALTSWCNSNNSYFPPQAERLQALVNIVDHMNREYPHLKPALHRPTLLLNWRAGPEQMWRSCGRHVTRDKITDDVPISHSLHSAGLFVLFVCLAGILAKVSAVFYLYNWIAPDVMIPRPSGPR